VQRRTFIRNSALSVAALALLPEFSWANQSGNKKKFILILGGGVRPIDLMTGNRLLSDNSSLIRKGIFYSNLRHELPEISHLRALNSYFGTNAESLSNLELQLVSSFRFFYPGKTNNNPGKHWHSDERVLEQSLHHFLHSGESCIAYLNSADAAHFNFSWYNESLDKYSEWAEKVHQKVCVNNRFELIILSDHGRNDFENETGGTDHSTNEASRAFVLHFNHSPAVKNDELISSSTIFQKIDNSVMI
jgi:hypothetical protein